MATFPITINPYYSWIKTPRFRTHILGYGGGVEQRIALDATAVYDHSIRYRNLNPTNKNTILDFFIARKGAFESFDWINPEGNTEKVRFEADIMNLEYFQYQLWNLNEVRFKGVDE